MFHCKLWNVNRQYQLQKKIAYLLIITGITMLVATIMYFSTVSISWMSYVGIIVGGLMLGIGTMTIRFIKKLKLDIKSSH